MQRAALISDCEMYRYTLTRVWGPGYRALFVMLNPSTADADQDDPTIRKCCGFAQRWGLDGIAVVNLYAYRATKPADMWLADRCGDDIVGRYNMKHVEPLLDDSDSYPIIVAAWGAQVVKGEARRAGSQDRVRLITKLLRDTYGAQCLGRTKDGDPRHPLMMPYASQLEIL